MSTPQPFQAGLPVGSLRGGLFGHCCANAVVANATHSRSFQVSANRLIPVRLLNRYSEKVYRVSPSPERSGSGNAHCFATVLLHIDTSGKVTSVKTLQGDSELLTAVQRVATQWHFRPIKRGWQSSPGQA